MGFAETFFGVVGEARRPTLELVSRLDFRLLAKPWLVMLYQVIRATPVVLEHAQLSCNLADELGRGLYDFYERKIREECGHEVMLLADTEAAGIQSAEAATPNPFIAEMVGRQYYLVDFVHPAAYLGFIGLLEGFHPTLDQVDELQTKSGLPIEAFRTARLHARADVKHREALAAMLDEVPPNLRGPILANALRCVALQNGALAHLSQQETQPWTP